MAKGKKGADKQKDTFGVGGDDFVNYENVAGRFRSVMDVINNAFHPDRIDDTKVKWTEAVTAAGGFDRYRFGKLSEKLLQGKFSAGDDTGQPFPTQSRWANDSYLADENNQIDPAALRDIKGLLRDSLKQDPPIPMYFWVKPSDDGLHRVKWQVGIIATMFCPPPPPPPSPAKAAKRAQAKVKPKAKSKKK
jgi:hypothetical protein